MPRSRALWRDLECLVPREVTLVSLLGEISRNLNEYEDGSAGERPVVSPCLWVPWRQSKPSPLNTALPVLVTKSKVSTVLATS